MPVKCMSELGYSCEGGSTSTNGELCPQGSYCLGRDMLATPCTADPGYFCPEGSHSPSGCANTHLTLLCNSCCSVRSGRLTFRE